MLYFPNLENLCHEGVLRAWKGMPFFGLNFGYGSEKKGKAAVNLKDRLEMFSRCWNDEELNDKLL